MERRRCRGYREGRVRVRVGLPQTKRSSIVALDSLHYKDQNSEDRSGWAGPKVGPTVNFGIRGEKEIYNNKNKRSPQMGLHCGPTSPFYYLLF